MNLIQTVRPPSSRLPLVQRFEQALDHLRDLFAGLGPDDRFVLCAILVLAIGLGFVLGRLRTSRKPGYRSFGLWRFPGFQNSGEALVARAITSKFGSPDYHLMNHVTIRMDDGTTQVDHILVSRFGVFVIETKDYSGWIFANPADATWTQVLYRRKSKFQNPIFQNYRHVRAVQELLDFLPPEAIKSVVVFTGDAEFKTPMPGGVIGLDRLAEHIQQHTDVVMSLNRLQFCVGRLETGRLAISRQTDVEHVQDLSRRLGRTLERR